MEATMVAANLLSKRAAGMRSAKTPSEMMLNVEAELTTCPCINAAVLAVREATLVTPVVIHSLTACPFCAYSTLTAPTSA